MAKNSKKQSAAQRLEAFRLTQQVNQILRMGDIQNQALLDSAGEQRPADESHISNLLEREKMSHHQVPAGRASRRIPRKKASRPTKARRAARRAKASKRRRR